jgi:hypothetical protein
MLLAPVWRTANRSAPSTMPIPVLRPSSAIAMPVKPASTTCRFVVWIWNEPEPRTSVAPPRPANAPAIAIDRTIERFTETPP